MATVISVRLVYTSVIRSAPERSSGTRVILVAPQGHTFTTKSASDPSSMVIAVGLASIEAALSFSQGSCGLSHRGHSCNLASNHETNGGARGSPCRPLLFPAFFLHPRRNCAGVLS
jgi:hypothetical protein